MKKAKYTVEFCPRCKAEWNYPASLKEDEKLALVNLIRQERPVEAVKYFRKITELELSDAKAFTQHCTQEKNRCHRCGNSIPSIEKVECPKCKSLNINW